MKTILLLGILLTSQSTTSMAASLAECRKIAAVAERVRCYDAIADATSAAPKAALTGPPVEGKDPDPRKTTLDSSQLFGTSDAEGKRIVEDALEIDAIDRIEATVTDTRAAATAQLSIELDNGQSWRQLDNQRLRIRAGDRVVIRKASLGSYLMEKSSGSRSIRVKRMR